MLTTIRSVERNQNAWIGAQGATHTISFELRGLPLLTHGTILKIRAVAPPRQMDLTSEDAQLKYPWISNVR